MRTVGQERKDLVALVADRDAEWGGLSVKQIEEKIQGDLNSNGWQGRSAVVVINPELEIWVWSSSPHVPRLLGTDWETIKDLGHRRNYWKKGEIKPSRPKELLVEALRYAGKDVLPDYINNWRKK